MKPSSPVLEQPTQPVVTESTGNTGVSQVFTPEFTDAGQGKGGNLSGPNSDSPNTVGDSKDYFGDTTADGSPERRIAVARAVVSQHHRLEELYGRERAEELAGYALGSIYGEGDTAVKWARAIGYKVPDSIPQEVWKQFAHDALVFASKFGDTEERVTAEFILTGQKPNRSPRPAKNQQEVDAEIDEQFGYLPPYDLEAESVPDAPSQPVKARKAYRKPPVSALGGFVTRSLRPRKEQKADAGLSTEEWSSILSALEVPISQGDQAALAAARRIGAMSVRTRG